MTTAWTILFGLPLALFPHSVADARAPPFEAVPITYGPARSQFDGQQEAAALATNTAWRGE